MAEEFAFNRPHYVISLNSTYQPAPAASTTYYFGNAPQIPGVTPTLTLITVPIRGPVLVAHIDIVTIGLASAETGSIYLRVNDTTDYLISSAVTWNTLHSSITNTTFPLTDDGELAPTDYVEIKVVTPAWGTLPTNVRYFGYLRFGMYV